MAKYRSDSEADFACLERYLSSGEFGELPDLLQHQWQHDDVRLRNFVTAFSKKESWMEQAGDYAQEMLGGATIPTRFDSPWQYAVLELLVGEVRSAAQSLGLSVGDFPHYACIPTGLVNACAVPLDCSSRPFLLFDSQLFLYCHLFAKAFAGCFPMEGEQTFGADGLEAIRKHLAFSPGPAQRLNELLRAYVENGSPGLASQYMPDPAYLRLISLFCRGMELFVVAHEFGHVYAGHLGDLVTSLNAKSRKEDAGLSEAHRQEHEADIMGMAITLKALTSAGHDVASAYIGVELFFISQEISARFDLTRRRGHDDDYQSKSSKTHPADSDRRALLNQALGMLVKSDVDVAKARAMAKKCTAVSELLWEQAKIAYLASRMK